jgi:hypothetical protein
LRVRRGWGEGSASREIQNRLKHRFGFLQNLIVPESQDPQTLPLQCMCPRAFDFLIVQRTAELDDQFESFAVEVHDARWNRMPAAEFESIKRPCAQVVPERAFGIGLGGTQGSGRNQSPAR